MTHAGGAGTTDPARGLGLDRVGAGPVYRRACRCVRGRVLVPASVAHPGDGIRAPTSPICSVPAAVDDLLSRRALRTPFIRMAKAGQRDSGSLVHPLRRPRGRRDRPGRRRQGAGPGGRRSDPGVAGAAPQLAAAGRVRQPAGDRARASGADQLLPDAAAEPGLRAALRHPRRVRAAGLRAQALGHPRAGRVRPQCPARTGRSTATRSRPGRREAPLLDTVLQPGDALYLPRGFHPLRQRAGRHLHPSHGGGASGHPLRGAAAPAGRSGRGSAAADFAADGRGPGDRGRPGYSAD